MSTERTPKLWSAARRYRRITVVGTIAGGLCALVGCHFGWQPALPAYLVLTTGLVVLSAIDIECQQLPNRILFPTALAVGILLAVASGTDGQWDALVAAAAGAVGAFGVLWVVWRTSRAWTAGRLRGRDTGERQSGLGFGDVRLAGLVGLGVGWVAPPREVLLVLCAALLVACGTGLVAGLLGVIGGRGWGWRFPFGPFLAGGGLWGAVWGPRVVNSLFGTH
jgi:leader peptidase (prepilin peptidase) / N-methyltransferase